MAHSLNNDESTEVSKTKSGGIVLEPVSMAFSHQQEHMGPCTHTG